MIYYEELEKQNKMKHRMSTENFGYKDCWEDQRKR